MGVICLPAEGGGREGIRGGGREGIRGGTRGGGGGGRERGGGKEEEEEEVVVKGRLYRIHNIIHILLYI